MVEFYHIGVKERDADALCENNISWEKLVAIVKAHNAGKGMIVDNKVIDVGSITRIAIFKTKEKVNPIAINLMKNPPSWWDEVPQGWKGASSGDNITTETIEKVRLMDKQGSQTQDREVGWSWSAKGMTKRVKIILVFLIASVIPLIFGYEQIAPDEYKLFRPDIKISMVEDDTMLVNVLQVKNSGLAQADKVEITIRSRDLSRITSSACYESNVSVEEAFTNERKVTLERFSLNQPCQITLTSVTPNNFFEVFINGDNFSAVKFPS